MKSARQKNDGQLLLLDLIPDGAGNYRAVRRPFAAEVGPRQAAQMLGVSRSQMFYLRQKENFRRLVKFRPTSEAAGKYVYDAASLAAYIEFLRTNVEGRGELIR